ncbi:hypothetical protein, partial [Ferrovum sp.]|uniref:hypothetical protein n=1 Tax=Ferrovum sp. TaxID=2609467 RepID=UPI0026054780
MLKSNERIADETANFMTLGQPSSNNQILEWYLRMTSPGKRQWGTSNAASSFAKGEFLASFEKVGKKWIIRLNLRSRPSFVSSRVLEEAGKEGETRITVLTHFSRRLLFATSGA